MGMVTITGKEKIKPGDENKNFKIIIITIINDNDAC